MIRDERPAMPVPRVVDPSASNDILWNLTLDDFKAWRRDCLAALGQPQESAEAQAAREEVEGNLLKVILLTDRGSWRLVDMYLLLIEMRPKEKVDPFVKKRVAN